MWRDAWQRLASRHQGEMWPLQWSLQQDGADSHTARNTNLQLKNLQFTEPKHFVHRIARIWTRLTCHLECSSADGFTSVDVSDCQKHGRNYGAVIANSSLTFLFRLMLIMLLVILWNQASISNGFRDIQLHANATQWFTLHTTLTRPQRSRSFWYQSIPDLIPI